MTPFVFILATIPGFAWLFFYMHEDVHPEPKRLIAFTFIMGGVFTFVALFLQIALKQSGVLNPLLSPESSAWRTIFPLVILAFTEEICKFIAAHVSVRKAKDFDEPVDAMIYPIIAALGFATVENIAVLQGQWNDDLFLASTLGVTFSRFIGATLLHALTSGVVGYYWAKSIREWNAPYWLLIGITLATILHAAFNYFVLNHQNIGYSLILIIIAGFFVLNDFEKLKARLL